MLRKVKASRVLYAHGLASMRKESPGFGRSALLSNGDVVGGGAAAATVLGIVPRNLEDVTWCGSTTADLETMVEQSCQAVHLCNPTARPADGDALFATLRRRGQKPVFWQGSARATTMRSPGRGILLTWGRGASASRTWHGMGPAAGRDFGAAKLPFNRFFSNSSESILTPPQSLLAVEVFNRSTTTGRFKITVGISKEFEKQINLDLSKCKEELSLETLKELYYREVEPALVTRGLISPFAMDDKRAAQLHYEYCRLLDAREWPYVTTLLDIMMMYKCLPKALRCSYFNWLSQEKAIVLDDWRSLGSSVGYSIYDHGVVLAPYGSSPDYYGGESDGSYKDGLADIGNIIWHGNKIVECNLFYGLKCKDSTQAEGMGVLYLQKRAKALGIKVFQVTTDNDYVAGVSSGLGPSVHPKLFQLLQHNRVGFVFFQTRWVPREKLFFVDDLIRLGKGSPGQTNLSMATVSRRWAPYLNGAAIFHLNSSAQNDYRRFIRRQGKGRKLWLEKIEKSCFIEVEDSSKRTEGMWHVLVAIRPASTVCIVFKDLSLIPDIEKLIKDLYYGCRISCDIRGNYSLLHCSIDCHRDDRSQMSERPLLVVLDPCILTLSDENLMTNLEVSEDAFTVLISTPRDRKITTDTKFPPLSPISFVSYHKGEV